MNTPKPLGKVNTYLATQLDEVARLLGGTIKMRKAREADGK